MLSITVSDTAPLSRPAARMPVPWPSDSATPIKLSTRPRARGGLARCVPVSRPARSALAGIPTAMNSPTYHQVSVVMAGLFQLSNETRPNAAKPQMVSARAAQALGPGADNEPTEDAADRLDATQQSDGLITAVE